jgi:hypothetical protein
MPNDPRPVSDRLSRRRLLGAGLTALAAGPLAGLAPSSCAAQGRAAQKVAPPPAGPLPAAPKKSRLGINLNGPADWNSELPFVDVFKLSRSWISQKQGAGWGKGPTLERDKDGWVTRLEPGCFAETPMLTLAKDRFPGGDYICLYEGTGEITFNGSATVKEKAPGRLVVTVDPAKGGLFLQLKSTDPKDYVRNIRFLMPGTEKTYRQQPYNPAFLKRWAGMNTFRFMDWMHTNNSKQKEWADRPTPTYCNYTERGVPVEVMLDVCNRLGVNPWFCMPHAASDDYVANFARLVKAGLAPGLRAYVEYSNEVWNGQFEQARYAGEQGMAAKIGDKPWEAGWHYTGRRSKEIFAIWERELGGRDRLVRVVASQAANPYVAGQILGFEETGKHCDALAIAPYFGLNLGPNTKPTAAEAAAGGAEFVLDQLEQKSLPAVIRWTEEHKKLLAQYPGVALVCYEAGQHAVGIQGGENDEKLTAVLHEANRSERMGALYTKFLDAWKAAGGDLCCLFASTGEWSKWGSWGLIEHNGDDTPKYRAVLAWNAANPRPAAQRVAAGSK